MHNKYLSLKRTQLHTLHTWPHAKSIHTCKVTQLYSNVNLVDMQCFRHAVFYHCIAIPNNSLIIRVSLAYHAFGEKTSQQRTYGQVCFLIHKFEAGSLATNQTSNKGNHKTPLWARANPYTQQSGGLLTSQMLLVQTKNIL